MFKNESIEKIWEPTKVILFVDYSSSDVIQNVLDIYAFILCHRTFHFTHFILRTLAQIIGKARTVKMIIVYYFQKKNKSSVSNI